MRTRKGTRTSSSGIIVYLVLVNILEHAGHIRVATQPAESRETMPGLRGPKSVHLSPPTRGYGGVAYPWRTLTKPMLRRKSSSLCTVHVTISPGLMGTPNFLRLLLPLLRPAQFHQRWLLKEKKIDHNVVLPSMNISMRQLKTEAIAPTVAPPPLPNNDFGQNTKLRAVLELMVQLSAGSLTHPHRQAKHSCSDPPLTRDERGTTVIA